VLTLKSKIWLTAALALASLPCVAALSAAPHRKPAAQGAQATTEAVLATMDKAAADFRSLTADIENTKYTDVVKDTSVEKGHIFVRKDSKMRIDITEPDPRTILRVGDSLSVYTPKIKRVEEYDLSKHRAMVDQHVLLGFGTRSEALQRKANRGRPVRRKESLSARTDAQIRRCKTPDYKDPDVDRFGVVAAAAAEIF
jgi:hypothetical protein